MARKQDAMKTILLCAALLILGMQAGVLKPALKSIGLTDARLASV